MITKFTATLMVTLLTIYTLPALLPKPVDISGVSKDIKISVGIEKAKLDIRFNYLLLTIENDIIDNK